MYNFHDNHNGDMPGPNERFRYDKFEPTNFPVSWRVQLLPYLEEAELYKQYRFNEPWDGPNNIKLLDKMPKVFSCPSADLKAKPSGYTHYRVFASPRNHSGPPPVFIDGLRGRTVLSITDGTSNTILIVEAQQAVPWTRPEFLPFFDDQPLPALGGLHTACFQSAMADGSVRFFRSTLSEKTLKAWVTADGGEVIQDD